MTIKLLYGLTRFLTLNRLEQCMGKFFLWE